MTLYPTICTNLHNHELDANCLFLHCLQGFVTHNEAALEELLGNEEYMCKAIACLNAMAARIATVFVSLKVHVHDIDSIK